MKELQVKFNNQKAQYKAQAISILKIKMKELCSYLEQDQHLIYVVFSNNPSQPSQKREIECCIDWTDQEVGSSSTYSGGGYPSTQSPMKALNKRKIKQIEKEINLFMKSQAKTYDESLFDAFSNVISGTWYKSGRRGRN